VGLSSLQVQGGAQFRRTGATVHRAASEEKIALTCGLDGRAMKLQAPGANVGNDLLCLAARRDNERGLAFGHAIELIEYVNKEDLPAFELSGCDARRGRSRAGERAVRLRDEHPATQESPGALEDTRVCMHKPRVTTNCHNAKVPTQNASFLLVDPGRESSAG